MRDYSSARSNRTALCLSALAFAAISLQASGVQAFKLQANTDEIGNTGGNDLWKRVDFEGENFFSVTPVVFVTGGISANGGQPHTIQVRNIDTTGFEFTVVEPEGSTNSTNHNPVEEVFWFALEPGTFVLADGTIITAGTVNTAKAQSGPTAEENWETVTLPAGYTSPPAVFAAVQSINNATRLATIEGEVDQTLLPPRQFLAPWATTAVADVSTTSFKLALERSETAALDGDEPLLTDAETIAYLAVSGPGKSTFDLGSGTNLILETFIEEGTAEDPGFAVGRQDPSSCAIGTVTFSEEGTPFIDQGLESAVRPTVIAHRRSRRNPDGGWVQGCALSATSAGFYIDEDGAVDSERRLSIPDGDGSIAIKEDLSVLAFQLQVAEGSAGTGATFPSCGDGVMQGIEECDDQNFASQDGCAFNCRIETGFECSTSEESPSECAAVCGDGMVLGDEVCDEGDASTEGCTSDCRQIAEGWQCPAQGGACTLVDSGAVGDGAGDGAGDGPGGDEPGDIGGVDGGDGAGLEDDGLAGGSSGCRVTPLTHGPTALLWLVGLMGLLRYRQRKQLALRKHRE